MAGKIRLNLDPNEILTVTDTVEIPTVNGTLKIAFDFIYRDRVKYAELVDEHAARAKAALELAQAEAEEADRIKKAGGEASPATSAQYAVRAAQRDVQAVKDIATGWNADLEWTDANLQALFVKHQGAGTAIAAHYSRLMVEGRLGNFVR